MTSQAASDARYTSRDLHAERQARLSWGSSAFQGWCPETSQPFGAGARSDAWSSTAKRSGFDSGWLARALTQLKQIDEEAAEEGYPPIGDESKRRAKRLLLAVSGCPIEPAVYPSMDGEIATYFKSPVAAAALLILVNNEGGAGIYSSIHGKNQRKRYDDSSKLPDDFLMERLRALRESALSQTSAATVALLPMSRENEVARHLSIRGEVRRERYEDPLRLPGQFAGAHLRTSGRSTLSSRL